MKNYDLSRFTKAQNRDYQTALTEIKNGKKRSHWMWYIFPQIKGLGRSSTAQFYSIEDMTEAKLFLADEYLGGNLREITKVLVGLEENNPTVVFGSPDDMKLKSSMTLFKYASDKEEVFQNVLDKYYGGKEDENTLNLLGL